ncbi:glutaredoxin family protein [Candidatus Methylospira mobilis]|uniref:Glutaredoxin family protein n=1 Tax=Candidatus Methylospira mobilis TaxID=1808979 RepID=A0A5Q0BK08_9GAMM|nr:glutaredoxin family protein [Candidatus Methylospira mobilis]QFY42531.1 glutaredoxin family protein [Candidatus Methylospira mobilis]WNV04362.1 glutaredoxin family protein [Candidatus Methylospira mobilis]
MLALYTTAGCHLCEQAEALLQQASGEKLLVWQSIEIAEQDELLERYGVRIPVLSDSASGDELGWPFSDQELIGFLDKRIV